MDEKQSEEFSHLIVWTVSQTGLIVFPLIWRADSIMIYRRTKQNGSSIPPFHHLVTELSIFATSADNNCSYSCWRIWKPTALYCIIFSCQLKCGFSLWLPEVGTSIFKRSLNKNMVHPWKRTFFLEPFWRQRQTEKMWGDAPQCQMMNYGESRSRLCGKRQEKSSFLHQVIVIFNHFTTWQAHQPHFLLVL